MNFLLYITTYVHCITRTFSANHSTKLSHQLSQHILTGFGYFTSKISLGFISFTPCWNDNVSQCQSTEGSSSVCHDLLMSALPKPSRNILVFTSSPKVQESLVIRHHLLYRASKRTFQCWPGEAALLYRCQLQVVIARQLSPAIIADSRQPATRADHSDGTLRYKLRCSYRQP